ncbi:MAG: helix-turn-helix domain-containing protein, partial [Deltaproteobacteria bacterium]|nr:helix-turn-helix domain-containing protein [Deltaproteobacteria bacterium]
MVTSPVLHLPRSWPKTLQAGFLHAATLVRKAMLEAVHETPAASEGTGADDLATNAQRDETIDLLKQELRIKNARMERIPPAHRPRYLPEERLAILMLKARTGWSQCETARRFQVTHPTVGEWMGRLDEGGEDALLRTPEPVNRFPDFVATLVKQLKATAP